MTGTPINQQLFVEWTSSLNTDHVLNSWDNRIFPPNAKVAQPVNPPYQPLYSLVPVSSTGMNGAAANLNLNWAVISTFNTGQISGPSTFTPDNQYAFVVNGSSSSVMVINMTTLVTSTIVVGDSPESIAATPDGKYVLVGSAGEGFGYSAMYVIQISSMTVLQSISMGAPGSIVITADSSTAYVVDYDNRVIQIINLINFSLAAQIPVGLNPGQIVITSDGNTLLIADGVHVAGDNTLYIINFHNNTVIKSLTLGGGPGGIAVSPDNKYAFVSNQNDSTISMIDLIQLSIAKTFTITGSPNGIAVTNDNKLELVCNSGNAVTVIDIAGMSLLPSITVGGNPGPICVTHDGLYAFVLNENDSTLSQIELSSMKVIQTITAGGFFTNYLSMSVDGKFMVVTAAGPVYILGMDVIGNNPDCIKSAREIFN